MELTPLICPRCGAVLEAKEGENEYRCRYCGVTVVRDAGSAAMRPPEENEMRTGMAISGEHEQCTASEGLVADTPGTGSDPAVENKKLSGNTAEADRSAEKNAAELKSSSVENDEKAPDGAGEKSKTAPGGFVSGKTPVPVPEVTLPGYILQCVKWALLPAFVLSLLMSVLAGMEYIFAGTLIFLPGFLLISVLVFFFRNLRSYRERRRAYEDYAASQKK